MSNISAHIAELKVKIAAAGIKYIDSKDLSDLKSLDDLNKEFAIFINAEQAVNGSFTPPAYRASSIPVIAGSDSTVSFGIHKVLGKLPAPSDYSGPLRDKYFMIAFEATCNVYAVPDTSRYDLLLLAHVKDHLRRGSIKQLYSGLTWPDIVEDWNCYFSP